MLGDDLQIALWTAGIAVLFMLLWDERDGD